MRGLKLVWPTCGMGKEGGGIGHQHVRGQGEYGGDGESVGLYRTSTSHEHNTTRGGHTHLCWGGARHPFCQLRQSNRAVISVQALNIPHNETI